MENIQNAIKGCKQAHQELYERYAAYVAVTIRNSGVYESDDVDDLVQDVFCVVLEHLHKLENPDCFRGWIGTIAHNRAVTHIRKKIQRRKAEDKLSTGLEAVYEPDNFADIYDVKEALVSLRDRDQIILDQFYFQGLSLIEIAEQSDCPIGTVKRRLYSARQRLKKILEGET